jgi:hypothetical protein
MHQGFYFYPVTRDTYGINPVKNMLDCLEEKYDLLIRLAKIDEAEDENSFTGPEPQ